MFTSRGRWKASSLLLLWTLFLWTSSQSRHKQTLAFQEHRILHHRFLHVRYSPTPPKYLSFPQQEYKKGKSPIFDDELIIRRNVGPWDGDDIRWGSKLRRRFYRYGLAGGSTAPARTALIGINFFMFLYQTINTVNLIRRRNPQYWPSDALSIISDTLLGATNLRGPLTADFIHNYYLSQKQPHRFLTAGFLHGDIIHLLFNLDALRRLPTWLETGLGTPIFLSTFLVAIVTGNIGHSISCMSSGAGSRTFCLGASGGICGIYGLCLAALSKMGHSQNSMRIVKGMLLLLLSGLLWDNVSNAAHVGGFVGGVIMGILCAPQYQKSYAMRRKWSLEADLWPKEYRQIMGFGVVPTKRGLIPVSLLWAVGAIALAVEPRFRTIPSSILRGLWKPGSLSHL